MKKRPDDIRPLLALSKAMRPTSVDVLEASLDAWASQRARETGVPFAKAYDQMLQDDPLAREFYADLRVARRDPAIIAKRRQDFGKRQPAGQSEQWTSDAERELNDLAEQHAERRSITKAEAYSEILKTEEGRALYATGDD